MPTTPPPPSGVQELCPTALHTPFRLAGDAAKSPSIWGVNGAGQTFAIIWPYGFTGRATSGSSAIEVLDPGGGVVARTGDLISDAGGGRAPDDGFELCEIGGTIY